MHGRNYIVNMSKNGSKSFQIKGKKKTSDNRIQLNPRQGCYPNQEELDEGCF